MIARKSILPNRIAVAAAVFAAAMAVPVPVSAAQSEGGLYIAGAGFSFAQAADQAIAKNRHTRRFFLLAVPPETRALAASAAGPLAAVRERVLAANGILLVCQRDIDNGLIDAADLAPRVVAVRGWPPAGSPALPPGARYFKDENPADLPASNEALRRLRSTCSH
jgi:hypothetical protein